jgi:hypothetical protein
MRRVIATRFLRVALRLVYAGDATVIRTDTIDAGAPWAHTRDEVFM